MEVSHTDFTEVTRMVLVHVGTVVVLTTSKTTTTGMLSVLAYTTVTGRDVTAAVRRRRKLVYRFMNESALSRQVAIGKWCRWIRASQEVKGGHTACGCWKDG